MVIVFCLLLITGILAGQGFDLTGAREVLGFITSVCLAYIMIDVGLEFSVDQKQMKDYGWDFLIAVAAAYLPAALWFGYFSIVLRGPWQPALVAGISSAPTSAGVLFALLTAAGLSATWVFKKARTLAVLDDLAVILLLAPLELVLHGFQWSSIALLILISGLLFASFHWQNRLLWKVTKKWLLVYACALTATVFLIKKLAHIHLEVLIPAFVLGCLVRCTPAPPTVGKSQGLSLDTGVKGLFMFLVGVSFPKISLLDFPVGPVIGHVLALTVLANLGKSFLLVCYGQEAPLNARLALSVAMFPRGEVGAAVLLIGLGYGFGGYITTLAMLSLVLNLVLTGLFVWIVTRLLNK